MEENTDTPKFRKMGAKGHFDDPDMAAEAIKVHYLSIRQNGENKHDYYVGITNDVEENCERHKIDKHDLVCQCTTNQIAADAEEKLGEMGFDIGDPPHTNNGGKVDTRYVYMFKKTDDTDPKKD